jgi:DNA polymerase-3 subunit beta
MNITIPGRELILALTGLKKVLAKRSSIPALNHVLVSSAEGHGCSLTATDLDGYVTYEVQERCEQSGTARTLVPLEGLQRLVKSAKNDEVILTPLTSNRIEVTLDGPLGKRSHYLNTLPEDEFPDMPETLPVKECQPGLLEAYRRAAPFASTDQTRMVLNGVRLDMEERETSRVVTTDGRRLCALSIPDLPLETSVTLPLLKVLLWNKLEDDCAIGVDENRCQLRNGPWTINARLIEGQFPNWRQVVPGEPGADSFSLSDADMPIFAEAVQTLPVRYPESNEAPLLIQEIGGQLVLSATDEDGNATTRVLPNSQVTPGLFVSVNRHKLKEAVDCGFVVWTLSGEMHPLCSRCDGNLHVLMPLRVDGVGKVPVPQASASSNVSDNPQPETSEPETPQPETPKEPNPMPIIEQEYDPTDADIEAPTNVVAFPVPEAPPQPESLDDLLVMLQDTRSALRDLNSRLGDIAAFVRNQKKQDKQLRNELANARGRLEKLRDIAA